MKSAIHKRKFHVARICIHRIVSPVKWYENSCVELDELTSDDMSSDGPQELKCHCDVTYFASTLPLLISSLPGQVQDMHPRDTPN